MSRRGQALFFAPGMLIFALFVLLPATQTWIDSLVVWKQGRPEWLGLGLYQMALSDAPGATGKELAPRRFEVGP